MPERNQGIGSERVGQPMDFAPQRAEFLKKTGLAEKARNAFLFLVVAVPSSEDTLDAEQQLEAINRNTTKLLEYDEYVLSQVSADYSADQAAQDIAASNSAKVQQFNGLVRQFNSKIGRLGLNEIKEIWEQSQQLFAELK